MSWVLGYERREGCGSCGSCVVVFLCFLGIRIDVFPKLPLRSDIYWCGFYGFKLISTSVDRFILHARDYGHLCMALIFKNRPRNTPDAYWEHPNTTGV